MRVAAVFCPFRRTIKQEALMCVIVYRPADHKLTMETLQTCYSGNRDGWGIMFAMNGEMQIKRGLDWNSFLSAYRAIPEDHPIAIHFRFRTHGDINIANTHPYMVWNGDSRTIAVMHNGVIQINEIDSKMSDTWHWLELVVKPVLKLNPNIIDLPAFHFLMENTTDGSRLLFLDNDGKFTFLHPKQWHDHQGCKFSNTYSLKPAYSYAKDYSGWNGHYGANFFNAAQTVSSWPQRKERKENLPATDLADDAAVEARLLRELESENEELEDYNFEFVDIDGFEISIYDRDFYLSADIIDQLSDAQLEAIATNNLVAVEEFYFSLGWHQPDSSDPVEIAKDLRFCAERFAQSDRETA
jgi:hypothetical protein